MAVKWTHITIGVGNFERSIGFYAEFCGLAVVRDRRTQGGGTVWLGYPAPEGIDPQFVLVIYEAEDFSRLDHFGFQCDSREAVDGIAARGRELGILVDPPTDSGGVVGYWTTLRDPDGHLVEFTFGQPLQGFG